MATFPWQRPKAAHKAATQHQPDPILTATERARLLGAARKTLEAKASLASQLSARFTGRSQADLARWQQARALAQHPSQPNPAPLQQLYDDILLDAHLTSVLNTRKLRLTGAPFALYLPNGTHDTTLSHHLNQAWFDQLLEHILDALFFGFSLIELERVGSQLQVHNIPRSHVLPQLGLVSLEAGQRAPEPDTLAQGELPEGWHIISELPYQLLLITPPAGATLGLLNQAVPLVLTKRQALANWREFSEVFGMPLRIGRTHIPDEERRRQLEHILKEMGSAAYAVLDPSDEIEFEHTARADAYRVYDKLVERTNLELSKLINGQTLTTEQGDRGARALGEIHDRIFDDITRRDGRFVERVVQEQVLPLLRSLPPFRGKLTAQHTFRFDIDAAILSLEEQWRIDRGLLEHFTIDEAYFSSRYNRPITGLKP